MKEEVERLVFPVASATLFALSVEFILLGLWLALATHLALAVASGAAAILCSYAAIACFDRVFTGEFREAHLFTVAFIGTLFAFVTMLASMSLRVPPGEAAQSALMALTATPLLGLAAALALALLALRSA